MIDVAVRALLLVTLLAGQVTSLRVTVAELARASGVDPAVALLVVEYETAGTWDPSILGDDGRALGLWQWHLESWRLVRKHMGASLDDLRSDPVESTLTTMHAWKIMNLQRWWSTYERAEREAR